MKRIKDKIKDLLSCKIEFGGQTEICINFFKKRLLFALLCPVNTYHITDQVDNMTLMKELQNYCLDKSEQVGKDVTRYKKVRIKPDSIMVEICKNIYII